MKEIFVVYCAMDYEGVNIEGAVPCLTFEQAEERFNATDLYALDEHDCYLEKWVLDSDEKDVLKHKRRFGGNETIIK